MKIPLDKWGVFMLFIWLHLAGRPYQIITYSYIIYKYIVEMVSLRQNQNKSKIYPKKKLNQMVFPCSVSIWSREILCPIEMTFHHILVDSDIGVECASDKFVNPIGGQTKRFAYFRTNITRG